MEKRIYTRLTPLHSITFIEEKFTFSEVNGQPSIFSTLLFHQICSLSLSLTLLINSIGYYPLYKLKQWEIHTEMKSLIKASLSNEKLKCISISDTNSSELHWEWEWEAEQEFTYKDNRYDVVRTEVKDHITHYYCIQDTEETKLFSQLEKKVERQMNDEKSPLQKNTKKLLKSYSWIVILTADTTSPNLPLNAIDNYHSYQCLYPSAFLNCITPPPKFSVS